MVTLLLVLAAALAAAHMRPDLAKSFGERAAPCAVVLAGKVAPLVTAAREQLLSLQPLTNQLLAQGAQLAMAVAARAGGAPATAAEYMSGAFAGFKAHAA
jgi:hypothetical protein